MSAYSLIINLDLEREPFKAICGFLAKSGRLSPSWSVLSDSPDFSLPDHSMDIELLVLFSRQESHLPDRIGRAIAKIGRSQVMLEQHQLLQRVGNIKLIDCGQTPSGPISTFFVLASYLEALAERAAPDSQGAILALQFDDDLDVRGMSLFETSDPKFIDIMMDHTSSTLDTLNKNFGQGDLPVISKPS